MKTSITLDLTKINKDRIVERKYTTKEGVEVTAKEYKIDLVELKEPQKISEGDSWIMNKTHFVVESPTKEERAAKVKTTTVGNGFQFVDKQESHKEQQLNLDEIPF